MSVYTSVSRSQLEQFLLNYSIGELVSYQGISEGIENTNYFVDTTKGSYVLTIFELLPTADIPFYVELMAYLNENNIPSAHPIADRNNNYLQSLLNKPAILMQRLEGKSVLNPELIHCQEIGSALAKLHLAGTGFELQKVNFRGQQWRMSTGGQLLDLVTRENAKILGEELRAQALQHYEDLPQGVIHADLFRDNVLFAGNHITGILDFYNACNDSLLYDVAITVNDWCVFQDGSLDFSRASALCQGYTSVRSVDSEEQKAWPMVLRTAALRFWLSRLWDSYHPKPGEMTFQKNPDEFKQILLARIREEHDLIRVWH